MCRLVAYVGEPVFLDRYLVAPPASLIAQSLAAREAKTIVNADGCGIGWYDSRPEPGIYHGVLPAWSDGNLASLCHQLRSGMFLAHVRSATSGGVSQANCHPFAHGPHMMVHNGQVGGYEGLRRRIDALIPDELYASRRGTSDSEAIFLAALGRGLAEDPVGAVAETLGAVMHVLDAAGIAKPVRFAAVHADGEVLRCYRWSSDTRPPSLYWREAEHGWIVASEPFDAAPGWREVPSGAVLTLTRDAAPRLGRLDVPAAVACAA